MMQKIPKLFIRIGRAIEIALALRTYKTSWFLSGFGMPPVNLLEQKHGKIFLKNAPSIDLRSSENRFILAGLHLIERLKSWRPDLLAKPDGHGCLDLSFDGIHLKCTTAEELFFVVEVFLEGVYNLNIGRKCVVVDIGANVGNAALFFAAKPEVEKVYSFELFPETAKLAQANFDRNPDYAKKIELQDKGVSDKFEDLELDYCSDKKGHAGIYGVLGEEEHSSNERQKVKVIDVSALMENIKKMHSDTPLVIKLDCEGAEYSIIERLEEKGFWPDIHAMMIEWHVRGEKVIVDLLVSRGFAVWVQNSHLGTHGMIYAVKQNN